MNSNDVLAHYGVLGMKWGVRRYQNKDGTLTEKGKEHYGSKKAIRKEAIAKKREDVKDRHTMSDDDLRKKIERIKLERELRTLTNEEVNRGRKFVSDVLTDVGKQTLTTALRGAALYGMKAAVSKEFNAKELGDALFNGGPKKK